MVAGHVNQAVQKTEPALLLVDAPSSQRDALVAAAQRKGVIVHARDDAMHALAELAEIEPAVVLVGLDPGPPGATSLCRILERKLGGATIFRLGDPNAHGVLASSARCLPSALSADEIVSKLVPSSTEDEDAALMLAEAVLAPLQFAQALVACAETFFSGRLWVTDASAEYEISMVGGVVVTSQSSVRSQRLGQVAKSLGLLGDDAIVAALDEARRQRKRLGQILLEQGTLSGSQLHRALSEQHLRRVSALCLAGECRVRFAEEPAPPQGESLLRVHPLTALLKAIREVGEPERNALLGPLGSTPLEPKRPSPLVDRFIANLGIQDLAGLMVHGKTVAALRALLASSLPSGHAIGPDAVLLLLLWSGRIGLPDQALQDNRLALREIPTGRLSGLLTLPRFDAGQLWSADGDQRATIAASLADYLSSPGERHRPRGEYAVLGPAVEACSDLDGFLARYHVDVAHRSPLSVLGLSKLPSPDELRHAHLQALAALDDLPSGPDDYALVYRRGQLQCLYNDAYQQLAGAPNAADVRRSSVPARDDSPPVSPSVAPEGEPPSLQPQPADSVSAVAPPVPAVAPPVPSAVPRSPTEALLLRELSGLVQQGRWADLLQRVRAQGGGLEARSEVVQLVCAVALREVQDPAGGQLMGASPEQLAIGSLSRLLGVDRSSPISLVLAKRILRRRPIEWTQPASKKASVLATMIALAVGASIGLALQYASLPMIGRLLSGGS